MAPDLPEYIIEGDYVSAALRTDRDLDTGEECNQFVEELRKRRGKSLCMYRSIVTKNQEIQY